MKNKFLFFFLGLIISNSAWTQPVISKRETINGFQVCPDFKKKNIFYYYPGDLGLAKDIFGKPLYKFIQMRYTGSSATGDEGVINYKSLLEFTVNMTGADALALNNLKAELQKQKNVNPELRTMPIRKMEAILIFALADGNENKKTVISDAGKFEQGEANEIATGEYWSERTYSLSLDKFSSQLLWATLEKGQLIMSVAYAFFIDGYEENLSAEYSVTSAGPLTKEINEQIKELAKKSAEDTVTKTILIKANAFAVTVNLKENSDRIKKIDINESWIPPDFPVMDIRCYDFNNELRPDLYAKRIEIIATGMDGNEVKKNITFFSSEPDIYYSGLRFKYAVRMDKPYKFRIVEINNDAGPVYGKWIEQKNWSRLIDITSKK